MVSAITNNCIGVELKLISEGEYSCRFCLVNRLQNSLDISSKKIVKGSLATVIESLPKNFPIALCLTGKGLLNKIINEDGIQDDENSLKTAFPGIDSKVFYKQIYQESALKFFSIVRHSVVDPLLETFERAGIKILQLTLGPVVTIQIWKQLNIYGQEIRFDGHLFILSDEKKLSAYQYIPNNKNEFSIKLGQESIEEEYIVAYATAFQLILHNQVDVIEANVNKIKKDFTKQIENFRLKKQGLAFIFSLFILLLLSFGIFSYYNTDNERLSKLVGSNITFKDNVEQLNQQISENEVLLKKIGWNGGYNYGFLLNELGKSMPKQLVLTTISMNDFKTDEEKSALQTNIKIMGSTDNLSAVNNWIFLLKEKSWIKSIKLLKYNQQEDSDLYQFDILLTY